MSDSVGRWADRSAFSPEVFDRAALERWAGDRERYLTFALDVTDSSVHDALEPVRAVLSKHDCSTVAPPEYYHVTLKQVGCVRDPPERDTDVSPTAERDLPRAAREALSDVDPFEVSFPRLNLFDNVVFCEVEPPDPLAAVHERLCDLPDVPRWNHERADYVPHVTLAHFRSTDGVDDLLADLEPLRDVDAPTVTVDSVSLHAKPPAELYPSTETVATVEL